MIQAWARLRRSPVHFAETSAGLQVYVGLGGNGCSWRSRTSATATIAAVSTRRMRGPSVTVSKPAWRAASTSAGVNPPSGPTSNAVASPASGRVRSGFLPPPPRHQAPAWQLGRHERRRERDRRIDVGDVGPPALPGRLTRDLLPAPAARRVRAGDRPFGQHRHDARHTQLAGLLHQEVHALTARHRREQHQQRLARRPDPGAHRAQQQLGLGAPDARDARLHLVTGAVEQRDAVARLARAARARGGDDPPP